MSTGYGVRIGVAMTTVPDAVLVPAPPEDLCLSFANTRYWRGSEPAATDTLAEPKALAEWLAANAPMPRNGKRGSGGTVEALFDEALRLREAIYRIFLAIGEGQPPPVRDLDTFNAALADTPRRLGVAARGGAYSWMVTVPAASVGGVLAPVIWSAADLLTHAADRRIRRCANDKCRWVFIDRSKAGTRRWCDMSSCGNRAKSHRHYARNKAT
jgi:predicted RNA-binding Zn ribbon-like protein